MHLFVDVCVSAFCLLAIVRSARILFVPAVGAPSHAKSMLEIAQALLEDDHEVHMLLFWPANVSMHCGSVKCVRVEIEPFASSQISWWDEKGPKWNMLFSLSRHTITQCSKALRSDHVFFETFSRQYWHLMVVDNVLQPCGHYFANKYHVPYIDFSTTILMEGTRAAKGINLPPSVQPSIGVYAFDSKSFMSRLNNLFVTVVEGAKRSAFIREYSGLCEAAFAMRLRPLQFHMDAATTFVSMPIAVDFPLPMTADMAVVPYVCPKAGGRLSQDYATFVEDDQSLGTIVIALGHSVRWNKAPLRTINAFNRAISRLSRYRIVWQYDGDPSLLSNSSHLRVERWLPLVALMEHPKTMVLVGHAGIKSLLEAVCHGIPMVYLPIFGDQFRNTMYLTKRMTGTFLDKTRIKDDTVYNAIVTVISNPLYKENQRALASLASDTIMNSTSTAKFWVNFHLRHPKAQRTIRTRAADHTYVTFLCVDVLGAIGVMAFSGVYLLSRCD